LARRRDRCGGAHALQHPCQNENCCKSSYLLPLLEGVPELGGKLKQPSLAKERKFEDVVKEAQEAAALVLVF
jgi:hypothetical protein